VHYYLSSALKPVRIQSNYKWNFIHILRFHDDIPEGMLNRYLFGGWGVECNFEPQGKEVGWDTGNWRQSHFVSNSSQGRC